MRITKHKPDNADNEYLPVTKRIKEMSVLFEDINWYQDPNYVTGSVKILDKNLKNYTAEFANDSFRVLVDGGVFWECTLEDKVIPKLCKVKAGSVRIEVKLRKQNPISWMLQGTNDSKVYNPLKRVNQSNSASVEEPETTVESPMPEVNPQVLAVSDEPRLQDSIPDTQPANSLPDTFATETMITPDPIPDAKDSKLVSENVTTDSSKAIPDSQAAEVDPQNVPDSHTTDPQTAEQVHSETAESIPGSLTTDLTSNTHSADPMDFQTTEPVPDTDTTSSIPDCPSTNSILDSQSANSVNLQNTEVVPDSQTTNSTLSTDAIPSTSDVTTPEGKVIPSSQTTPRSDGPRRAASSSSVAGADPIASSGDLAIDSDDVIVMPEDVEDDVLEIAHLNHDWLDKIPSPVVMVTIQIRSFDADSLRVKFSEDSFQVIFKTRAEMFLKMIPGATEDTFLCWKPKVFGKIIPKESKHWLQKPTLHIQMKKAVPDQRWKTLEAPASAKKVSSSAAVVKKKVANKQTSATKENATTKRDTQATRSSEIKSVLKGSQSVNRNTIQQEKPQSNDLSTTVSSSSSVLVDSVPSPAKPVAPVIKIVETSQTGLVNLGNTCYMNSIIQSLSNTRELRDYLLNGYFMKELNTTNPLGYKGKLVESFASLLKRLWNGQNRKLSPHSILSLMASKYNQFTERSQHDAHEFMSFLLDGLHEDMNRVVSKPSTDAVEQNNRPDQEVAQEAWEVYCKRNDSFVVDTFQGQFKSTLYCTVCKTMSVTFDPLSCLAVPLPKKMKVLPVILVRRDSDIPPVKYMLKLPDDSTVELLKGYVGKKAGILITKLRVFEAYKGKFQIIIKSSMSVKSISDTDVIIVSEVLSEKEAGEAVIEISVLQRLALPFHPTKCANCGKDGDVSSLKRCTKCFSVAYCNRDCQMDHWKARHSAVCKTYNQQPTVGIPFIVSLPKSQFTYNNLCKSAEKLARLSVNVEIAIVGTPPQPDDTLVSTGTSNTDNTINSNGSTELLGSSVDNAEEGGAMSTSTSKASSLDPSTSLPNHVEEVPDVEKPKFFFTPVNRFGVTVGNQLEDKGDGLVDLKGIEYLALDWRNNPKQKGHVEVTEKGKFYKTDSSCSTTHTDDTNNGPATLDKCLHLFTEPETLSSEEAWYCPKCKSHQEAIKQMSPWKLPKILIIQLKRFTYQNCIWKDKISKDVSFPIKGLDMSKYMAEGALKDTSQSSHPPVYDLYATVNHFGSVFFGHYMAYIRPHENEEWILYDDDRVQKSRAADVSNQHAYLLFYRLRN